MTYEEAVSSIPLGHYRRFKGNEYEVTGIARENLWWSVKLSRGRLSLYGDCQYPLARDSTLEQFYKEKPEGEFSAELLASNDND